MTGVEAVSNGVRAFREPAVQSAQRPLSTIIGILGLMLADKAWILPRHAHGKPQIVKHGDRDAPRWPLVFIGKCS